MRLTLDFLLCSVLTLACASVTVAGAQTVTVQILNGRSGKPVAKVRVYIVLDDPKDQHLLDRKTDRSGEIHFESSGAKTFQVRPIGEVACGEQPVGAPIRDYQLDEVLRVGIVTRNDCGRSNPEPVRGRLVYVVRPATWSELFKN